MEKEGKMKKTVRLPLVIGVAFLTFVLGFGVQNIRFFGSPLTTVSSNKSLRNNLDYSTVEQVYDKLREDFDGQLDMQKLLDGAKKGLVDAAGDPYTTYLSKEQAELFSTQLSGTFSGIGAELSKRDNRPVVISPIEGYPAQKIGVKAGDIIIEIDGQDTSGMSVDDAVLKIRGEKGTKVTLKIVRTGTDNPLSFEITRDTIVIESVKSEMLADNIAYIRLTQFGDDTATKAIAAAKDLKSKGAKAVILDLRGNGGGYLNGAVNIAGIWMNNKLVTQEKRDGKVVESLKTSNQAILDGLPTVVLIDGGSASASEIVSGALQDNKVATLVGQKSFGKGSVQQVEKLGDGSEVKVTIARWYTPAGKNIDKEGIKPDVEVELKDEDVKAGKDTQKDKAIEILKSNIK